MVDMTTQIYEANMLLFFFVSWPKCFSKPLWNIIQLIPISFILFLILYITMSNLTLNKLYSFSH